MQHGHLKNTKATKLINTKIGSSDIDAVALTCPPFWIFVLIFAHFHHHVLYIVLGVQ